MSALDVVNVFCDRGHARRPTDLAAFARQGLGRWSLQGPATLDPRVPRSVRAVARMVWVDDTPTGPRLAPGHRSGDRRAYTIGPCPMCRLTVNAPDALLQLVLSGWHDGRTELLDLAGRPAVESDADFGVSRIALSLLGANLGK